RNEPYDHVKKIRLGGGGQRKTPVQEQAFNHVKLLNQEELSKWLREKEISNNTIEALQGMQGRVFVRMNRKILEDRSLSEEQIIDIQCVLEDFLGVCLK
ncbi:hypothetical protein AKO1_005628, partial [Acrasis kona]